MHFAPLFLALLFAQAPAKKAPVAAPKTAASPKTAPAKAPATPAKPAVRTPQAAKPAASAKPAAVALTTDEQKTVYALGLSIHRSIASFDLSAEDIQIVQQAIADAAAKKPAVELSEWGPKLQGLQQSRAGRVAEKEKAASAAYLAKAATELGSLKTDSGLIYREVSAGSGASPQASDTVKVHYRGTLIDGTEFDSSYKRNEPAQFPLNQVIPCWTEGVQKMKVGGKARLVCPSSIAYGDQGRPSIPGGAALLFDIELLEIIGAK
jgi:FKBP-type peptidyl-prolyl cis-trans isomerase FkpA